MNDESDPLKRLIIGSWVNDVGDQNDIEFVAELFEVSLDFLGTLSPEISDKNKRFVDGRG